VTFAGLISDLNARGVRFVVIGGVAAGVQGSTRATFDLDICYDPAPDNVKVLARLLADRHAYLRGVEPGLPFTMDERAFRTTPVMTLTTDAGPLDVMDRVGGVGEYPAVLAASIEVEALSQRFRALGLPALVAAKKATGRPKDQEQLPELEALLALQRQRAKERRGESPSRK
jgi:predicted nucleotidyltransferase